MSHEVLVQVQNTRGGALGGLDLPVVVVVALSGLELHLKRGQHALYGQRENGIRTMAPLPSSSTPQ